MRAGVLLLLVLTAAPAAAQERDVDRHAARLEAWADPIAQALLAAIPAPFDELAEYAPWDYEFQNPPGWGCPVSCSLLTPIAVKRTFVIVEPALEAKVKANEELALANAIKITGSPADERLHSAQRKFEQDDKTLKDSVRRLSVEIMINVGPPTPNGAERPPTRAGEVAGYPVMRFAYTDANYDPLPEGVRFALMIGPPTFRPTKVKDISDMKTEARTAVVSVALTSRSATVKADEVVARKLLERVDLAAIAKLLK